MALAAQPSAELELLPGSPTTVLITCCGEARAAFVLPVPHEEVCRAMGHSIPQGIDPALDRLWEEQRQDDMVPLYLLDHEATGDQVA